MWPFQMKTSEQYFSVPLFASCFYVILIGLNLLSYIKEVVSIRANKMHASNAFRRNYGYFVAQIMPLRPETDSFPLKGTASHESTFTE